jgi:hypothetical protein
MADVQNYSEKSSERSSMDDSKNIPDEPLEVVDSVSRNNPQAVAQVSGERPLVLMDLENGLVGWESDQDPENPQ